MNEYDWIINFSVKNKKNKNSIIKLIFFWILKFDPILKLNFRFQKIKIRNELSNTPNFNIYKIKN